MKYVDGYVCAFGNQRLCFQSSLSVSDWASWVQAVGSIAALLIAIWIMAAQQRGARALEAERRLNDRLDQVDGVNALLLRLRAFLRLAQPRDVPGSDIQNAPLLIDRERFDGDFVPALAALRTVPIHAFGATAFFILQALDHADAARAVIEELLRNADFAYLHGQTAEDAFRQQERLFSIAQHGHSIETAIQAISNAARAGRRPNQ